GFRVGAIATRPNENLGPERLKGMEAGVGFTRRRLALRATGWWSRLDDPVTNVTVGALERQRQNVGGVNGRGLEAEVVLWPASGLEWSGAVALTRSVFDDRLRPGIDGRDVPQVPAVQWSSRLRYGAAAGWVALEVRGAGRQFEDDRNELPLRPFLAIDVAAGYRVARWAELLVSFENVGNTEIEVGRTPVPTIGLPRSVHVGVRVIAGR
ncbi:MAG: TonB-dependent receptor, partial [Acidobacteria bacterium]